jgi:hypothetical protein
MRTRSVADPWGPQPILQKRRREFHGGEVNPQLHDSDHCGGSRCTTVERRSWEMTAWPHAAMARQTWRARDLHAWPTCQRRRWVVGCGVKKGNWAKLVVLGPTVGFLFFFYPDFIFLFIPFLNSNLNLDLVMSYSLELITQFQTLVLEQYIFIYLFFSS